MTVTGEHDARPAQLDLVEAVQKLLLRRLLVRDEVHIIDRQQIELTDPPAEALELVRAHRGDVFVGELLAGRVQHVRIGMMLEEAPAHALKQVRLAQAARAVQKQRRARLGLVVGEALRGGVGELIARADHELIQPMAQPAQCRGVLALRRRGFRRAALRRALRAGDGAGGRRAVRVRLGRAAGLGLAGEAIGRDLHVQVDVLAQLVPRRLLELVVEVPADPVRDELVGHGDAQRVIVVGVVELCALVEPHGEAALSE